MSSSLGFLICKWGQQCLCDTAIRIYRRLSIRHSVPGLLLAEPQNEWSFHLHISNDRQLIPSQSSLVHLWATLISRISALPYTRGRSVSHSVLPLVLVQCPLPSPQCLALTNL